MIVSGLLPGGVIRYLILAEMTRKTDSCPICRRENSKISPLSDILFLRKLIEVWSYSIMIGVNRTSLRYKPKIEDSPRVYSL